MDYIDYLEVTGKSEATQAVADKLADELNDNWWKNNRYKYIQYCDLN